MKLLLFIASLLYGVVVWLRNRLFDNGVFKLHRASIPVVSVGNLSAGGAGKTPFVDWIVKFYHRSGKRAAIISRGYGRTSRGVLLVGDGNFVRVGGSEAGDEPLMLARRNPNTIVIVAEKRADAVQFLTEKFKDKLPDVIVLDDGFQHRQLARDLNLVVIHAEQSPFLDALLPLGRLREPADELRRADMILLSKVTKYLDLAPLYRAVQPFQKPMVKSQVKIVGLRSFFSDEIIPLGSQPFLYTWAFAFSGIGDPKNFMETLQYAGLIVNHEKHFPDHHAYTAADMDYILSEMIRHNINIAVTTEKDFYRLKADDALFNQLRQAAFFYVEIEFDVFEGKSELEAALLGVLNRR
ncbi:MAG: hypothetical protein HY22_14130 [[Candidatus Thermochlorobacteriaceae] bacterium GBChlB]|nr:MAG: hypothetical protein HY22_14130 [[Candidatus Thermochlorobacteriaceae] bacterium GBChlB]